MGSAPRSATPIRLLVRVSSMVDFTPSRAATATCTRSSGCSSKSVNSLSVLPNAHVSLPVRALTFLGGSMPRFSRYLANIWLLIRVLSTVSSDTPFNPMSSSSERFLARTSSRCFSSRGLSSSITGSVYMRSVWSIAISSDTGKPFASFLNSM